MITPHRVLSVACAALLLGGGCTNRPPPTVPAGACFVPDSGRLAFGSITIDSSTEDASGLQIVLAVDSGRLGAWYRDARGQMPPLSPFDSVTVTGGGDSLFLRYYTASGTQYTYRFRAACDTLRGFARLFQTKSDTGLLQPVSMARATLVTKP